jgi:hypothetical protein
MCQFVSLAGPIATIIAAAAAVFVTWRFGQGQLHVAEQQAATARQQAELAAVRLQHDLFDRRFAIYEAAHKLAVEVFDISNVSNESSRAFKQCTEKSEFLLDKELSDYLNAMLEQAVNLHIASERFVMPGDSERSELAKERADLSSWFVDQLFGVLIEKFKPDLTLDKRQLSTTPNERIAAPLPGPSQPATPD